MYVRNLSLPVAKHCQKKETESRATGDPGSCTRDGRHCRCCCFRCCCRAAAGRLKEAHTKQSEGESANAPKPAAPTDCATPLYEHG